MKVVKELPHENIVKLSDIKEQVINGYGILVQVYNRKVYFIVELSNKRIGFQTIKSRDCSYRTEGNIRDFLNRLENDIDKPELFGQTLILYYETLVDLAKDIIKNNWE